MNNNFIFTERSILITVITAYYRAGMISLVNADIQALAKTICINILHFLNSGHSRAMNGKKNAQGDTKVINAYSKLITDCFLSICNDKPNENGIDCLQECARFIIECLNEYNSLDKKIRYKALDTVTVKNVLLYNGVSSNTLRKKCMLPEYLIKRLTDSERHDSTVNYGKYRIVKKGNGTFSVYKHVTVKTYKEIDKPIRVMKLIYRHMSAFIKGNKAIIANMKTLFVDDIDDIYNNVVKVDRMTAGMIQFDNATTDDIDRSTAMIESMGLTQRQRDVLAYRLRGKSMQWICKKMNISDSTFRTHVERIQDKAKKSELINTSFIDSKTVVIKDNAVKDTVQIGVFKDDTLVGVYDSMGKCAIDLGLNKTAISNCINGRRSSHKGYTFRIGNGMIDNTSVRYEYGSQIKGKKHVPNYESNAKCAPWYTSADYQYKPDKYPLNDEKVLPVPSGTKSKGISIDWIDDSQIRLLTRVLKNTVARA